MIGRNAVGDPVSGILDVESRRDAVEKPFTAAELVRKVREALDR